MGTHRTHYQRHDTGRNACGRGDYNTGRVEKVDCETCKKTYIYGYAYVFMKRGGEPYQLVA